MKINMNSDILNQDIQQLLEYFSKNMYKATKIEESSLGNDALQKCSVLLKLDYNVLEIPNDIGELSTHYPSVLLVPEHELKTVQNNFFLSSSSGPGTISSNQGSQQQQQETIYENNLDSTKLRDLFNRARFARCRARFPVPIILYRGKYICRSSTLSGGPEIYTRSGIEYFFTGSDNTSAKSNLEESFVDTEAYEALEVDEDKSGENISKKEGDWKLFNIVRNSDIKLLKTLNVGTIVDFMVENKKVKFMMNVTSSEKIDKEKRYQEFKIVSLPYPGCEFFRKFRDNNYSAINLVFDWTQTHVDATIGVPEDEVSSQLNVDWNSYKNWDLVQITQNYLKLLIKYLQDSSSGLLIHCISGWDRTPLFVSLLRLSLWADGVIHQSLNAIQILYFTIAYDWLLFGHNLPDRLGKGEEIFFFCFYALEFIIDNEYSILGPRLRSKHSSGSSSIGVIRADSDILDGLIFENEDSRGSSISMNSSCSNNDSKMNNHHHMQHVQNLQISSSPIQLSSHFYDENNGNFNSWTSHSQDSNNLSRTSSDSVTNVPTTWLSQSQKKRTSPVSVPTNATTNNGGLRQRQESTSSVSVGSWQMISQNGSLRSQDSNIVVLNEQLIASNQSNNNCNSSGSSNNSNYLHQNNCEFLNSINPPSESTCTIVDDDCFTANDLFMRRQRLMAVRTLFYNCYKSTIGYKFKNGADSGLGSFLGNFAEKVGLTQRTPV